MLAQIAAKKAAPYQCSEIAAHLAPETTNWPALPSANQSLCNLGYLDGSGRNERVLQLYQLNLGSICEPSQ
eukprot:jgi/Chrzof1/6794/Cz19g10010.t1